MMTTTSPLRAASRLFFALLVAAVPFGTGCVGEVDSEGDEGSDGSALEHAPFGDLVDAEDEAPCELGETRVCVFSDPGVGQMEGFQTCVDIDGEPTWDDCQMSGSSTPLVLSFDDGPVAYSTRMSGSFDLTGLGVTLATDWPTAKTPWLALDRDGSGTIDGGHELFGSATALAGGARADNGFSALRELDSDGDGRITPRDDAWSQLVLWSDRDGDRASATAELAPLSSRGVTSIELSYARDARCDSRGNCEIERAAFTYEDAAGTARAGTVIDIHLRWQ